MSKVNNDKSDTKKQGGENGHSFIKNTGGFHEAEECLARPATAPVPGASGKEPSTQDPEARSGDKVSQAGSGKGGSQTAKPPQKAARPKPESQPPA